MTFAQWKQFGASDDLAEAFARSDRELSAVWGVVASRESTSVDAEMMADFARVRTADKKLGTAIPRGDHG